MCSDWAIDGNFVTKCGQAGIWVYGTSNVIVANNNSTGNNTTATDGRFDIMVGYVLTSKSLNCKVYANQMGTFGISDAENTIVTNNTIGSIGHNFGTNTKSFNNFINGTWTA